MTDPTDMNPSGQKQRKSGPKSNAGESTQYTKRAKVPIAQESESRQKPLPEIPEVKRVTKTNRDYCGIKNGSGKGPKYFDTRCCRHRNETKQRSAAHEIVCMAGGHHSEVWNVPDHVSESEKDSEEEILVTTSESESDTKEEAGEDSGPGSDWAKTQ